jgi:hypothetical protein
MTKNPQNEDDLQWNIPATTEWIVTYKIREKPRGNLECGSAQPSLLLLLSGS